MPTYWVGVPAYLLAGQSCYWWWLELLRPHKRRGSSPSLSPHAPLLGDDSRMLLEALVATTLLAVSHQSPNYTLWIA